MLLKAGVDISRLNREIRRALRAVSDIFMEFDQEVVVTSTYEGDHGAGSLHYANDAFDVRYPGLEIIGVQTRLRNKLGNDFDILGEKDHIHIEYDPN